MRMANPYFNLLVWTLSNLPCFRGLTRRTGFAERKGVGGLSRENEKGGHLYQGKLKKDRYLMHLIEYNVILKLCLLIINLIYPCKEMYNLEMLLEPAL